MCYLEIMKRLLLITFSDIAYDSRIKRHIKELSQEFSLSFICVYSSETDSLFRNNDFKNVHYLEYTGKRSKKTLIEFVNYNIILRIAAYRLIRAHSDTYDIIYANDFETALPAYLANRKPLIYDSHELWTERAGCRKTLFHTLLNNIERFFEKRICRKSYVITVSDGISRFMEKTYGISNISIIRNIPEPAGQCTVPAAALPDRIIYSKFRFVYAGGLSAGRNTDMLINAFREIEDATLTLAGTGDAYAEGFLSSNVYYAGHVNEACLNDFLQRFDIGIHALPVKDVLNHQFALPNKLFQYMHAGLALCFFENDSTRSIIDVCSNGIYGITESKYDIVEMIKRICSDDICKYKRNSENCAANYTWESEARKLHDIMGQFK